MSDEIGLLVHCYYIVVAAVWCLGYTVAKRGHSWITSCVVVEGRSYSHTVRIDLTGLKLSLLRLCRLEVVFIARQIITILLVISEQLGLKLLLLGSSLGWAISDQCHN